MANGISINILSNVRGAVQGVTDVAEAVEEAADRLHDLTKEGDTAADRMEGDFREISRAADRSADQLRDKFRQAYKDIRRSADDATDGAKKGFQEFKTEGVQNISEVASSFDGSFESLGEVVQGTLGGATQGLGLLGAAAVPAALAVGGITEAFTKAKEATDEAKQSAYEYGLTVAESGKYADASARINELTGDVEGLTKVTDIATVAGWNQTEVLAALATGEGLQKLITDFNAGANATDVATKRVLELQGVLDGTAQGFALSGDAAKLQAAALYDLATQAGTATDKVDSLGNTIVTMPDGKEVVINAATGTAYENVTTFEQRFNELPTSKDVFLRVKVQDQTQRDLDRIVANVNRRRASLQVGAGWLNRRDAE